MVRMAVVGITFVVGKTFVVLAEMLVTAHSLDKQSNDDSSFKLVHAAIIIIVDPYRFVSIR